ncbi:MAG: hypothetical protein ACI841_003866 [Planctomycetota bacterium]|jgi:hypothetical protein
MRTSLQVLAAPIAIAIGGQATAQFSDDFEAYAAGSDLDGQGGWRGWDGVGLGLSLISDTFAYDGTRSVALTATADTIQEFDLHAGK